jgi:hypothetical protein
MIIIKNNNLNKVRNVLKETNKTAVNLNNKLTVNKVTNIPKINNKSNIIKISWKKQIIYNKINKMNYLMKIKRIMKRINSNNYK